MKGEAFLFGMFTHIARFPCRRDSTSKTSINDPFPAIVLYTLAPPSARTSKFTPSSPA